MEEGGGYKDDLLIQVVAKYSTLDVLGHDWREVASEVSGRLPQYYKDHYRLTDTVARLTFVFLCVTFHVSTSLSHSLPVPTLLDHTCTQVHRLSEPKLS